METSQGADAAHAAIDNGDSESAEIAINQLISEAKSVEPAQAQSSLTQVHSHVRRSHLRNLGRMSTALLRALSEAAERRLEFNEAADKLMRIDLVGEGSGLEEKDKFAVAVRSAMLLLEVNDAQQAESALRRVNIAELISKGVPDGALILQARSTEARILDGKRRFLEASQKYFALSKERSDTVSEEDADKCAESAIKCATLSSASRQKESLLQELFADRRCMRSRLGSVLRKLATKRLVAAAELETLESELSPHQKALGSDMTSLHWRRVMEHNAMSVMRWHSSVTVPTMASLLNLGEAETETLVSRLVSQRRVDASIDGVQGCIDVAKRGEEANMHSLRACKLADEACSLALGST